MATFTDQAAWAMGPNSWLNVISGCDREHASEGGSHGVGTLGKAAHSAPRACVTWCVGA